ncbi:MAG TPA: F0F1 ATP synthase subunit gamma, partial [Candidatus Saccharimonadales bacterium]|nr:F0F1 ATP synthase subunit gamma [Candidatus Saccharimonadales bacterium]
KIMGQANQIEKESHQIATVEDLTGVFESIASTQVAKVKNKVQLSTDFFKLLWKRYRSIRIDPSSRITERNEGNGKQAFIIISAEAGLSGDIDLRLIEAMLENYDSKTTDIVVLGSHGATQLKQRGIPYIRYFKVPETDKYIDVGPVIDAVVDYDRIAIYFAEYVSLGVQEVKTIDLISRMKDMTEDDNDENIMTDLDTIFEPSLDEIADEMEQTMMTLALSQTILESNLAQAASRFNAMAVAKKRAGELLDDYTMAFHRAKRADSDRRMREVMISLKKKHRKARKA